MLRAIVLLCFIVGCGDNLSNLRKQLDIAQESSLSTKALLQQMNPLVAENHPARPLLNEAIEENEITCTALAKASKTVPKLQNKPDTFSKVIQLAGYIVGGLLLLILIAVVIWYRRTIKSVAVSLYRTAAEVIPRDLPSVARKAITKSIPPDT